MKVKIRIYHGKGAGDEELVRTVYVETNSAKRLTGKRAGKILANNFPKFDNSVTRAGLIKTKEGFFTMRVLEPMERCDHFYSMEYVYVTEDLIKG